MNPRDISLAKDKDLAASFTALKRSARTAREIAIRTNTPIVVYRPGEGIVHISAEELRRTGGR